MNPQSPIGFVNLDYRLLIAVMVIFFLIMWKLGAFKMEDDKV